MTSALRKLPYRRYQSGRELSLCCVRCKTTSAAKAKKIQKHPSREIDDVWYSWSELFKRVNWEKLLGNDENRKRTEENCHRRGVDVDFSRVIELYEDLVKTGSDGPTSKESLYELMTQVNKIPNDTHTEAWKTPDDKPGVVHMVGAPPSEEKTEFHEFCKGKNLIKLDNLGTFCGHRANVLKGPMAECQQALIRYSIEAVCSNGFQLVSVPDVLFPQVVESCGMATTGDHHQVYFLDETDLEQPKLEACLSGTAEMALAGLIHNRTFSLEELPLKLAAVSRCYRAEASSVAEEHGLFRVHYFTKVEMFGVTSQETGKESNDLHLEFLEIEESLFKELGLHFKTLEMPPYELGLSAHRKFDVEAWQPGKKSFGEISSCSNCTDFQSRRLNARYKSKDGSLKYVHTVNGTACAVPRMLIVLTETYQTSDGFVDLPPALAKHMHRSWKESSLQNHKIDSYFLRSRSQMDAVTQCYV